MTDTWNAQQLREILKRGDTDIPALQDAGIVSKNTLNYLLDLKNYHPDGLDSREAKIALERGVSHGVHDAVQSGDQTILAHLSGKSSTKEVIDMAEWRKYEALKDLWRNPAQYTQWNNNVFQAVIFSDQIPPTGRGKTSFAYTMAEVAQAVHPDLNIITNNPSDKFTDTPRKWTELEDMIRQTDDDQWSLLIMDEAAQFLQYSDRSEGLTISRKMKLLRHEKCHLILIGHTGRDVPADIRRQMFFINKKSEKRAVLGYGLTKKSKGDRMKVEEELITLKRISHTSIEYNSQGEKTINIQFDDGSEVEEEESEEENEEDEEKKCEATTNDGNPCPAVASHPPEDPRVCINHRHRLSDIQDSDND